MFAPAASLLSASDHVDRRALPAVDALPLPVTWLHDLVLERIPLTHHLGLQRITQNRTHLYVHASLTPNLNHVFTAFGGSLQALCTLTGWCHMQVLLRRWSLTGDVVIQKSQTHYCTPVRDDIITRCGRPSIQAMESFQTMAHRRGKGRLTLAVEVVTGQQAAVCYEATYVALNVCPLPSPARYSSRKATMGLAVAAL